MVEAFSVPPSSACVSGSEGFRSLASPVLGFSTPLGVEFYLLWVFFKGWCISVEVDEISTRLILKLSDDGKFVSIGEVGVMVW